MISPHLRRLHQIPGVGRVNSPRGFWCTAKLKYDQAHGDNFYLQEKIQAIEKSFSNVMCIQIV